MDHFTTDKVQLFDLYKYRISFRARRKKYQRPGQYEFYGSSVGVFLSACVFTVMGSYLIYLIYKMYNNLSDKYQSIWHVNDFEGEQNNLKMSEFSFLPSIGINFMKTKRDFILQYSSDPSNDLFTTEQLADPGKLEVSHLNFENLSNYIEL